MARYVPTKEVLDYYENTLKNDPVMSHVLDNWEHLPFPPQLVDPPWYVPTISREEWGALPPKPGATPLTNRIMNIRWTWAGKEDCYSVEDCSRIVRNLQKSAMEQGLPDIQYNFLVGGKGVIYEGRGWDWEADREERHDNFESLFGKLKGQTVDIAYIGDMSFYGPMNDVQMGAFHFVQESVKAGHIDQMFDSIPYRERPTNYEDPNFYFDRDSVPPHVIAQVDEANRKDAAKASNALEQ